MATYNKPLRHVLSILALPNIIIWLPLIIVPAVDNTASLLTASVRNDKYSKLKSTPAMATNM